MKMMLTPGMVHQFNTISNSWLKADVKEVMSPNADLMYLHKSTDQYVMKDIVGGITLWDEKFIRRA
jgi:hypothetical protein